MCPQQAILSLPAELLSCLHLGRLAFPGHHGCSGLFNLCYSFFAFPLPQVNCVMRWLTTVSLIWIPASMSPNVFPWTKEPGKSVRVGLYTLDKSIPWLDLGCTGNEFGAKITKINTNHAKLCTLQSMPHFNFNASIHTFLAFCGLLENNGCILRAEELFWNRAWQQENLWNSHCIVPYPASQTKDSFLMCSLGHL